MTSTLKTIFWSVVVTVAMVGAVAAVGQPAAASHGNGDSSYVDPGSDYTEATWDSVWWGYGPNAHETGEQSGWAFRSTANDERGGQFGDMEYFQYVAIHAPWADMSDCAVTDTDVAGIDRGDDNWDGDPYDPSNDDSLVQDIQNSNIIEHYGYFQFAGPDGFGDRGINLNETDSFTAGLSCFQNPEEEGWYRLTVWFNGTRYDGSYAEYLNWNEWKYFCDDAQERCSNRQEARETLGPPPSEFDYPTGQRVQNYEPDTQWAHTSGPPDDSEDQQTDSPTPTEATGGDGSTPTPTEATGGDGSTPTPTEVTDGDGSTPTPTEATGGDGSTPTPTEAVGGQDPGDDDDNNETGGDDGANQAGGTPTSGGGPGLGPLVALFALLGAALLTLRRR